MKNSFILKFLTHTIEGRSDVCWEWTGSTCDGYGRFTHEGAAWKAHRASYTIYKGPIPNNKMVLHSCHNRRCVNPGHLKLGNHRDNMEDRRSIGRYNRDWNGRAVISEAQANLIWDVYVAFDVSYSTLAKVSGLTKSGVAQLIKQFKEAA